MGTHRNGQPGDESDHEDDEVLGAALRHPNRLHVTLENLADLADIAGLDAATHRATNGGATNGRATNGDAADGTWLSKLPTPSEDQTQLKRRGRHRRPGAKGSAPGGPQAPPGTDAPPTTSPKAPRPPVEPATLIPAGAYSERPAWIVPAARRPGLAAPIEVPLTIRSRLAQPLDRWLLELLAVGLASVAFVTPTVWLVGIAVACAGGGVVAFVAGGRPLATLPPRALRRTVLLLHPRSSLWAPVLIARTVIVAAVVPAGIAAAAWIAREGSQGAVAAARAGAWTHGFRVAAVLACVMLLTSVGDGRHQRAATVRRWAAPATDGTLATLAVTCGLVMVLAIVAAPHPIDPIASRADGLGWLPPAARAWADRMRDDIVTTELDALASCLSTRGGTVWRPFYDSGGGDLGAPDVARMVASREPSNQPPRELVTVLLAAHNQLAPWVDTIEVEWPGGDLVRTERATLPRHEPLVDAAPLVAATTAGGQWLSSGSADRAVALRCSAAPVL